MAANTAVLPLSVITVNHNADKYTFNCVKSIQEKTRTHYEIIIVDNNSSGWSGLLDQLRSDNVTIIKNHFNSGFARANNLGIKTAKGEFILLLNNDTLIKNNALDLMIEYLKANPKTGILTCKMFAGDGTTIQRNARSFYRTAFDSMFGRASLFSRLFPNNPITSRNVFSNWDYNSDREVDWVSGACMMIRREVFQTVGLLDENYFMYFEDTDICQRARRAGWQVRFIPSAEIIHFEARGGGKRSLMLRLSMIYHLHRSAYHYFRKNLYRYSFHPMNIITWFGMFVLVGLKAAWEVLRSIIRQGNAAE